MGKKNGQSDSLHIVSQLTSAMSSGLFEDLVENFPDIIHSVGADGRIVSTNRKAQELLGYTRDELIGMHIFNLYAEEVLPRVKKGFEELKTNGFNNAIESKLRSKGGDIIDVEIRSFSLYDSENAFERTFSIIRDIREKKQLQAQLYHQRKLAGIGELAAGIIHDIRNPLAVIMSLNRNSLKKAAESLDSEKILDIRAKIDKASERINRLCSHLRDYTRQEREAPSLTKLSQLVEDCLMICDNRIKTSRATIVNDLKNSDLELSLPANGLEQALINLISNACDAVAGCEQREVRIRVEHQARSVTFIVEDTGLGVPENMRGQIYDSFFTTKAKGKGTGLGLSICKGIIAENSGTLELDESYTEGARFVIRLPFGKAKAERLAS